MRFIVINSLAAAFIFISMSVALCVWWYGLSSERPMFKSRAAESMEFVRTTSDIERLREFTQKLMWGHEAIGKRANQTLDLAVNVIACMSLMCGMLSLLGMGYAFKTRNEALGVPLKWWLHWL